VLFGDYDKTKKFRIKKMEEKNFLNIFWKDNKSNNIILGLTV
jgi:hypothetical protein